MQVSFTLTIQALDYSGEDREQEIDAISKRILFEETKHKVNIVQSGKNGIGQFNYSYRVHNFGSDNSYECSIASVPVDNSTDEPQVEYSSLIWALIAVAIMLLILLLVTIIIAVCIVRNMSMKLKDRKGSHAHDSDGEHTCIHILSCC